MTRFPVFLKILLLFFFIGAEFLRNSWIGIFEPYTHVIEVAFRFSIFALTLNLAILTLIAIYRRRKKLHAGQIDNVVVGLQNIYYLILTGGFLLTLAAFWNLNPVELFTSLSIVAAAIAIISKDYISEIISGMIITFSRELSIDDYIKIGDQRGKVIDITITKIALLNEDDDVIFLPNNKVYTSEIVNYTKKEIKKVSIEFEMNIQSLKTVEELESDLINAISDYQEHIVPKSYNLKIVDIRKDSIDFKFQYVLHQINRELEREIRRKTVRRIVNYVKKNAPGSIAVKAQVS